MLRRFNIPRIKLTSNFPSRRCLSALSVNDKSALNEFIKEKKTKELIVYLHEKWATGKNNSKDEFTGKNLSKILPEIFLPTNNESDTHLLIETIKYLTPMIPTLPYSVLLKTINMCIISKDLASASMVYDELLSKGYFLDALTLEKLILESLNQFNTNLIEKVLSNHNASYRLIIYMVEPLIISGDVSLFTNEFRKFILRKSPPDIEEVYQVMREILITKLLITLNNTHRYRDIIDELQEVDEILKEYNDLTESQSLKKRRISRYLQAANNWLLDSDNLQDIRTNWINNFEEFEVHSTTMDKFNYLLEQDIDEESAEDYYINDITSQISEKELSPMKPPSNIKSLLLNGNIYPLEAHIERLNLLRSVMSFLGKTPHLEIQNALYLYFGIKDRELYGFKSYLEEDEEDFEKLFEFTLPISMSDSKDAENDFDDDLNETFDDNLETNLDVFVEVVRDSANDEDDENIDIDDIVDADGQPLDENEILNSENDKDSQLTFSKNHEDSDEKVDDFDDDDDDEDDEEEENLKKTFSKNKRSSKNSEDSQIDSSVIFDLLKSFQKHETKHSIDRDHPSFLPFKPKYHMTFVNRTTPNSSVNPKNSFGIIFDDHFDLHNSSMIYEPMIEDQMVEFREFQELKDKKNKFDSKQRSENKTSNNIANVSVDKPSISKSSPEDKEV